jgi:NAD(P)-dependent dehydrogenase (short-subunit alcohol dehydrogenase family)
MKNVVITGASRGIGLATTKLFLENGWRVIGTHNATPIPLSSANLVGIQLDLSSSKSIAEAALAIQKEAPSIDILINNAGVSSDAFEDGPNMETVRATFEVNVFGLVDLTERLLPFIANGGSIVNISSRYGAFSFPIDGKDSTAYSMSKATLNMYTRKLAFRLSEQNITVSSIHPGWVNTDMGNSAATESQKPDREPDEAAKDIYTLATSKVESGKFWQFGKEREW